MAAGGVTIASLYFNVSNNAISRDPLPPSWHSPSLAAIDVSYCGISGGAAATSPHRSSCAYCGAAWRAVDRDDLLS